MSKYYVSKYACTKGILEVEVETSDASEIYMAGSKPLKVGKHVFASHDDARMDATKRVRAKVSRLVKKETELESLIDKWDTEVQ